MPRRLKVLILALVAVNALLAVVWLLQPRRMEDRSRELRTETLEPRFERLKVLEAPWLDPDRRRVLRRGDAPGATFAEYLAGAPVRPGAGRAAVDLQPLGELGPSRRKLVELAAEFLRRVSGLEVRLHEPLPLPSVVQRTHHGFVQVLEPGLEKALEARVPADSLGLMSVLAVGLYPSASWNFVFWGASDVAQVTVGSLQELGDPDASPDAFRRALARTLKLETQQLLSLLSVPGCVAWECLNNPSDGLDDLDREPLHLCPACLQKLCWNTGCDPARTQAAAAAFLRENGLADGWYDRAVPLLSGP